MFKLLVAITVLAVVAAQSSSEPSRKCSSNQTWALCGQICEPTCDVPNPNPFFCPAIECTRFTATCRCKSGYVRNVENQQCVKLKDCHH